MEAKIFDLLKIQMVMNYHPSRIVQRSDIQVALDTQPFLSSIAQNISEHMKNESKDISQVKQLSKKYNKYVFTNDALFLIQTLIDQIKIHFPTKRSMEEIFPMFQKQIDELYKDEKSSPKVKTIKFKPKIVTIDPESKLFHTTNSFEVFERNKIKTPYGTSWLSMDKIYEPEKTIQFHSDRGPLRVIQYQLLSLPHHFDSSPIEHEINVSTPNIMDARKIDHIPKESIEEYFNEKGVVIKFPSPNLEKNILSQYGRTFRPFVVDYLKTFGLDGVLVKDNQIAFFQPERWLEFESIEQGEPMYLALSDLLNNYDTMKDTEDFILKDFEDYYIPKISEKNDVDLDSLRILFQMNRK
jgi:hypothetical protein